MKKLGALVAALMAVCALSGAAHAQDIVRWSGDVDDDTLIILRGRSVSYRYRSGKTVTGVRVVFVHAVPRRGMGLHLSHPNGRGSIRIVQRPNPRNNFATIVRVRDADRGRGHYEFALAR